MNLSRLSMADSVISRFKIEKIEDGLSIGGTTVITAHCYLLLFVFAFCFLLAGIVLTFISYRPLTSGDSLDQYLNCLWFGGNTHVAGPVILVVGLLMLVAGLCLWAIARKIRHNEASAMAQQMTEPESTSSTTKSPSDKSPVHRQRSQSIPTISKAIVDHKRFSLPPIIPTHFRRASFIKPANNAHLTSNSSFSLLDSSRKQDSHISLPIDDAWPPFTALSDEPFDSIASLSGTEDIASFPERRAQRRVSLPQLGNTAHT